MKEKVLITGGTGLIGNAIVKQLQESGYEPILLSRSAGKGTIKTYQWDVEKGTIDAEAMQQADHIIHLAGAPVNKRWTKKYKQEIIDSRVKSAALLHEGLLKNNRRVKTFVSASGIGYYGERGEEITTENDKPGNDFLANVCVQWEAAADAMKDCAYKIVKFRTGIVLSTEGGALPPIAMPMKFRVAAIFGNGRQCYSWIHIDDLAAMYVMALSTAINGACNAVAPNPISFIELVEAIEKAKHIKTIHLPLPLSLIKIPLGEFAETVYQSIKVSSRKIEETGFSFRFATIDKAMSSLT